MLLGWVSENNDDRCYTFGFNSLLLTQNEVVF